MMLRYGLAALALTVVANAGAATTAFQALPKIGDEENAMFCGVPGAPLAQVNASGRIRWQINETAHIPIEKTETLDWVWVHAHPTGLYIAYEATDRTADGSRGGICKYATPGYKQVWCTHIPAFNVVAAMSDSAALYVAGIGMAGRINHRTGKYIWKVDGLYETDHAFNVFRVPIEEGANVVFYASAGIKGSPTKRLVVGANSGRVIANETADLAASLPQEFPRLVHGCKQ